MVTQLDMFIKESEQDKLPLFSLAILSSMKLDTRDEGSVGGRQLTTTRGHRGINFFLIRCERQIKNKA